MEYLACVSLGLREETSEPNLTFAAPWRFGTIVYHRCAAEKRKGMITGYSFDPRGISVRVSWGDCSETWHHVLELTTEFLPDYESD